MESDLEDVVDDEEEGILKDAGKNFKNCRTDDL